MAQRIPVTCPCGTRFEVASSRVARGLGKYCSRACMYRYMKRPSGLTYNIVKDNPSWFKPGQEAWNKGLKGRHFSPATEFKPGERSSPATEFKPGQGVGDANVKWAGDDVGYGGLHSRVYKERGSAADYPCAWADGTCKGPMHWANVSGQYLNAEDFLALCQSHHFRYDRRRGRN